MEELKDIARHKASISSDIHPVREKAPQIFSSINQELVYHSKLHPHITRIASLHFPQENEE